MTTRARARVCVCVYVCVCVCEREREVLRRHTCELTQTYLLILGAGVAAAQDALFARFDAVVLVEEDVGAIGKVAEARHHHHPRALAWQRRSVEHALSSR